MISKLGHPQTRPDAIFTETSFGVKLFRDNYINYKFPESCFQSIYLICALKCSIGWKPKYMSHSDVKSPVADNRTKWSLIEALSLIGALDTHFLNSPWQPTGEVGPKMSSTTPRRKPYYVTQIEYAYALL